MCNISYSFCLSTQSNIKHKLHIQIDKLNWIKLNFWSLWFRSIDDGDNADDGDVIDEWDDDAELLSGSFVWY